MCKSTAGHVFDSTQSLDYRTAFEYNNLQDPYLKDYFYRPYMHDHLISKQWAITEQKHSSKHGHFERRGREHFNKWLRDTQILGTP